MKTPAWIEKLFTTIDKMDATAFAAFLAPDCVFKFGNSPETVGREAARGAVEWFFTTITAIDHTLQGVWTVDNCVLMRGESTYGRPDGNRVTLPFLNYFEMGADNLIQRYQIYIDVAPIYAPMPVAEVTAE